MRDAEASNLEDASTRAPDAAVPVDAAMSSMDKDAATSEAPPNEPGEQPSDCPAIQLDYTGFADGFFATNCRSCHSASKTGTARGGAPANIDFDTEADIISLQDRIRKVVLEEKRMPPTGRLSACSLERLDGYLDALPDPGCTSSCTGKACGDDGCGGSCGSCAANESCDANQCVADTCVPQCDGASCGPNSCGGTCGECSSTEMCTAEKQCACVPSCSGKTCGPDGCGGTCGSCGAGTTCDQGSCVCTGSCEGKQCGDDGCGVSCGSCAGGSICNTASGTCQASCTPNCAGRQCGDDGCSGSCGTCAGGLSCNGAGQCVCQPNCAGRQCGGDGCVGSCGPCENGACNASGQCIPSCVPNCAGRQCGDNGCGGTCGACAAGQTCTAAGTCTAAAPNFATDVYPIFAAAGCGSSTCHGGSAPSQGLNLSSATLAQSMLVGVAASQCGERVRVAPGAPDDSYLISKLTSVDMCGGQQMPRGGTPLSSPQLDTIRAWIRSLVP